MLYRDCIKLLLLFFILSAPFKGYAQFYNAPLFTCAQHRNSNVELTWEIPTVTCGTFNNYTIWVSNSLSTPFTLLTTITTQTQTAYTHIGATTTQKWYYYLQSDFNCPGQNSLSSDTFYSTFDFVEPTIKTISIVNNKAVIEWYPNPELQTHSYLIFIPQTSLIDSIIGRLNTKYTDSKQDPNKLSVAYSLVAQDKCRGGDYGKSAESFAHSSIFLKIEENACTGNVILDWTPYIGWDSVHDYQIYVEVNNGGEKLIETNTAKNRNFSFNSYVVGDSICMRIMGRKAKDTAVFAYSNQICFRAAKIQKPRYFIITKINVLYNKSVEIEWITDSLAKVKTVAILRGFTKEDMNEVGRYTLNNKMPFISTFIDSTAPTGNLLYYQISLIDSCNESYTSHIKNHLHLAASQKLLFENKLNWTFQDLNNTKVAKCIIYRKTDSVYYKLLETNNSTNSYIDNIENLINEKGIICYKIEVIYTLDTLPLYINNYSSFSNEICISQRALVHVPNAFKPDGINNVFKPMIIFGSTDNYLMQIFNRWGALVFETKDPTEGWNGTINGSPAPMEHYAYTISLNSISGVPIDRKGMVLLVR